MRSRYSDVSWLLRAARVVPVIAAAALLGGMIGGFAMFAIDSALTWEPSPQSGSDARMETQASTANPQSTQTGKPVRIVGGAIPDPSAGMSAPPPAPQQQRSTSTQSQNHVSPDLLTPKPLGPASPLRPQPATTTAAPSSGAPPQNQIANPPQVQTSVQAPVQTQNAAPSAAPGQQQTHWPDALSRAHQNATGSQPQTAAPLAAAPATPAQTGEGAANKNREADRQPANSDRAASADNQDRADSARHSRHSRRHAWRYGGEDDAAGAGSSSARQQARGYDRLYDSYGNRRDRSYGNRREQFYRDRDEQNDTASRSDPSRSDVQQYGRDTRYRGRSRAIGREQPDQSDRSQAFESQPRPEPFWGGGFFRRGDQDDRD